MPVLSVTESQAKRIARSVQVTESLRQPFARPFRPKGGGGGVGAATVPIQPLREVRIVQVLDTDPVLGPHMLIRLQNPVQGVGGEMTRWVDATNQIVNVTVGGTIAVGRTFSISLFGGVVVSYVTVAGDTADTVRDALIAQWNASAYAAEIVATAGGTGVITLTAQQDEAQYDYTLNTPGGGATFTQADVTTLIAYGDAKAFEAFDQQQVALSQIYPTNSRFWMTRDGGLAIVMLQPTGITGLMNVLTDFDPLGCSFTQNTLRIVQGMIVESF